MTLEDLQGNVVVGYGSDYAHYIFARVTDPAAARTWLSRRLDHVTFNGSWRPTRPRHTLNLAFTHAGLVALGVPPERFDGLDAFAQGMAARNVVLGDAGACAPETWPAALREAHVLVTLTAWQSEALAGVRAEQEERLNRPESGLTLTYAQPAETLTGAREHFGFSDGFSQPAIAGADTGPRDGEGTRTRWRRWRDLALGEFVLGHLDEGGLDPVAPSGLLGAESTFMVVRKLEQDVGAFRAYLRDQARVHGRDEQWLAAKLVGRWQNGSSLVANPDREGIPADKDRVRVNQFRYGDDPAGRACPLGAHVRRANPRDALGWESRLSQRHRILRRGMSYGPPLAADALVNDGEERGLMFVCYQASIERQFEFIQHQWLGDGNVFGLADDRDPLVASDPGGPGAGQMVIQGSPPLFLSGLPRFVTTRGGDYFLVPGRAGLAALAAGRC